MRINFKFKIIEDWYSNNRYYVLFEFFSTSEDKVSLNLVCKEK